MKNRTVVITGSISGISKKTPIYLYSNNSKWKSISKWKIISKKKMFWGINYLLNLNMIADIHNIQSLRISYPPSKSGNK